MWRDGKVRHHDTNSSKAFQLLTPSPSLRFRPESHFQYLSKHQIRMVYVKLSQEAELAQCPDTVRSRFNSGVRKGDLCWIWTRTKNARYGKFKWKAFEFQVNRAAWILSFGVIPVGMFVLHRCDNPKCVNPSHLWLGTQTDNMRDASNKGRVKMPKNTQQGRRPRRISEEMVREIKSLRKD